MRLLPRQDNFHRLFLSFATLLEKAATDFNACFQQGGNLNDMAERMQGFEREADALGVLLFDTLHKSFVTPHDPEDIYALIHNLDSVMDGLEDIAHRCAAYHLTDVPDMMRIMSALTLETAGQIRPALEALENKGDVMECCLALKNREAEMDTLSRQAIARLFADDHDAITLMKHKEIYEYFGATAKACAQVATILGRIHIKGG